jgi:hypothetical protein
MNFWQILWAVFGNVFVALWLGMTLLAALVGVWAILGPDSFIRFNRRFSVWIEFGKSEKVSRQSFSIERPFYRHHIATGLLMIIASIYVLYEALFVLNERQIEQLLMADSAVRNMWAGVLLDATFGWIYITGVLALLIGILVVIRPSYLKGIETRMNYWVETEKYTRSLDNRNQILDEWVCAHPKTFGIISLFGSALVAWSLFYLGYLE